MMMPPSTLHFTLLCPLSAQIYCILRLRRRKGNPTAFHSEAGQFRQPMSRNLGNCCNCSIHAKEVMIQGVHKINSILISFRSYFFGIPSPYSLVYDGEAGVFVQRCFQVRIPWISP